MHNQGTAVPDGPKEAPVPADPIKLPVLSLRALRHLILNGEPGCVCDPELFTGPADVEPEDEPPEDLVARVEVARQVCAVCPVRRPCLVYALRTRPAAGVWAGFTPEEITGLIVAAARPVRVQLEGLAVSGLRKLCFLKPLPAIPGTRCGPPAEAGTRSPSVDASDCSAVRCSVQYHAWPFRESDRPCGTRAPS